MRVDENSVVFPGDARPKFDQAGSMQTTDFVDHVIHINNHLGTHIDAPGHMVEGGAFLEEIDVKRFVGSAVCIDARSKQLSAALLDGVDIQPGVTVLFFTGCSDFNEEQRYAEEYPKFGEDLARSLIAMQVSMVGVDMISYDHDAPYPIHKMLLGNDILLIENLANLGSVVGKKFKLYALPIRLDLEAAPARVIAEIED
jgi:kynurenine formamidase